MNEQSFESLSEDQDISNFTVVALSAAARDRMLQEGAPLAEIRAITILS